MEKLIAVNDTDEMGKIFYRVTGKEIFGIKIDQERGILKTAEVENLTRDFGAIKEFAEFLAKGKVTAVMLFGMCDDFLDAGKLP